MGGDVMRKRFGKVVLDTETAEFLGWWIEGGRIAYAAYLQDKVLFARKILPNGREDLFPSRPTRALQTGLKHPRGVRKFEAGRREFFQYHMHHVRNPAAVGCTTDET